MWATDQALWEGEAFPLRRISVDTRSVDKIAILSTRATPTVESLGALRPKGSVNGVCEMVDCRMRGGSEMPTMGARALIFGASCAREPVDAWRNASWAAHQGHCLHLRFHLPQRHTLMEFPRHHPRTAPLSWSLAAPPSSTTTSLISDQPRTTSRNPEISSPASSQIYTLPYPMP
jgi:hypothetical protein